MIPSDIDTASSMYLLYMEVFVVWIVVFGEQNILRMCLCLNWEPTESENPITQSKIKNHLPLNEKTKLTFKFVLHSKHHHYFRTIFAMHKFCTCKSFAQKRWSDSKKTKSSVRIFVFTSAFSWWARICAMCDVRCVRIFFSSNFFKLKTFNGQKNRWKLSIREDLSFRFYFIIDSN